MLSLLMSIILLLFLFRAQFFQISNHGSGAPQILLSLPTEGVFTLKEACSSSDNIIRGCSEDCSGIKLCMDNQTFIINCLVQSHGKNAYCNRTNNLCQSDPVECSEMKKFYCPRTDGFYPDPFDCKKFYQCYFGASYEGNCIESVFNPKIPSCESAAPCYNFSSRNGLCKGKIGKIVSHPLDENMYVYCEEYPRVLRCPPGFFFEVMSMICKYDCKIPGVYPDENSYEWYYICQMNGLRLEPYHLQCPSGLYFNKYFNVCIMY